MPNARKPRKHDFFFSPGDYLRDPAVVAMNTLARGVYSTLLFSLWDQDDPGMAPDDDATLAGLARATPEEWSASKAAVSRAFDTSSIPGYWVQKRMVSEYDRQSMFFERSRLWGKKGRDKQLAGHPRATPGSDPGASPASPASPAKSKSSPEPDSTLGAGGGLKVRTVRTRTGRTLTPEAQAQIDAMREAGLLPPDKRADETYFEGDR